MTVLELINKYDLGDFDKHYKNLYGNLRDTAFSLEELKQIEVKAVSINFPTMEATITLKTFL